MPDSLAQAAARLKTLTDRLPPLPDDVAGWIAVHGTSWATLHVDFSAYPPEAGATDAAFDATVAVLSEQHGDGHELTPDDAGWRTDLRSWVLERPVDGWHLSVTVRR